MVYDGYGPWNPEDPNDMSSLDAWIVVLYGEGKTVLEIAAALGVAVALIITRMEILGLVGSGGEPEAAPGEDEDTDGYPIVEAGLGGLLGLLGGVPMAAVLGWILKWVLTKFELSAMLLGLAAIGIELGALEEEPEVAVYMGQKLVGWAGGSVRGRLTGRPIQTGFNVVRIRR